MSMELASCLTRTSLSPAPTLKLSCRHYFFKKFDCYQTCTVRIQVISSLFLVRELRSKILLFHTSHARSLIPRSSTVTCTPRDTQTYITVPHAQRACDVKRPL